MSERREIKMLWHFVFISRLSTLNFSTKVVFWNRDNVGGYLVHEKIIKQYRNSETITQKIISKDFEFNWHKLEIEFRKNGFKHNLENIVLPKRLKETQDCISFARADKGNTVLALKCQYYIKKTLHFIQFTNFVSIPSDST